MEVFSRVPAPPSSVFFPELTVMGVGTEVSPISLVSAVEILGEVPFPQWDGPSQVHCGSRSGCGEVFRVTGPSFLVEGLGLLGPGPPTAEPRTSTGCGRWGQGEGTQGGNDGRE